jgi:hypothetical protein
MERRHAGWYAVLAGAVAGAVVLGAIGRIAVAGVALIIEGPVNISARGVLEVVVVGVLVGAIGGILLLPVRSLVRGGRVIRGLVLGAVLFIASFLLSLLRGWTSLSFSRNPLPLTLVTVAAVYVIFAITADALLSWFERSPGAVRRDSRPQSGP